VRLLLTPSATGQFTPLEQTLASFGISQDQIAAARDQIITNIEGVAGQVVPLLTGIFSTVLDVVLSESRSMSTPASSAATAVKTAS
jgi:hypothetical protein